MIPLTGVPGTGKFIELNVKLKLLRWRERKRGSYYSMGIVFVWGDDKVLEMGCTLKKGYPFMLKKKKVRMSKVPRVGLWRDKLTSLALGEGS